MAHQNEVHFSIKSSQPGVQCSRYCARPAKTADCGFSQPCATQDHEWKKADAGSFVADIDLLVIIIDANSNKTKSVPACSSGHIYSRRCMVGCFLLIPVVLTVLMSFKHNHTHPNTANETENLHF